MLTMCYNFPAEYGTRKRFIHLRLCFFLFHRSSPKCLLRRRLKVTGSIHSSTFQQASLSPSQISIFRLRPLGPAFHRFAERPPNRAGIVPSLLERAKTCLSCTTNAPSRIFDYSTSRSQNNIWTSLGCLGIDVALIHSALYYSWSLPCTQLCTQIFIRL
jgi:hypothetical protein